jgi:hypothetical protein
VGADPGRLLEPAGDVWVGVPAALVDDGAALVDEILAELIGGALEGAPAPPLVEQPATSAASATVSRTPRGLTPPA